MVDDSHPEGTPLEDALAGFRRSKEKGENTGNYQRNAGRVVTQWIGWLADQHPPVETVDELDVQALRRWARYLKRRVNGDGITGATARTYWDYVSAFLTWCVEEELLHENPARKKRAESELPVSKGKQSGSQQFWTPEDRRAILTFVDDRAYEAVDDRGTAAVEETRDRALVALLAYSGVRGAEVLRSIGDDRRTGIAWSALDLEAGTIRILGKSQEVEIAQLPTQASSPLDRYRQALNPPTDDWPVFPTRHRPTLYTCARGELAARDVPDERIDALLEDCDDVSTILRDREIVPPSLTTDGARSILQRLCEQAEIDVDGGYLKPHGARRGLGETLYRERGPGAAQRALRHKSPETTSEAYSHIDAADLAEDVSDVFEETDR